MGFDGKGHVANATPFFIQTGYRDYQNGCYLAVGHENSHSDSGYYALGYGEARSNSEGNCKGLSYINTSALASGIAASARAYGSVTFQDQDIFQPQDHGQPFSRLNFTISLLVNGWQGTHTAGLAFGYASTTLTAELAILDDNGYVAYDFLVSWDGPQTIDSGQLDYSHLSLALTPGHSYSAIVKFSQTSAASTYGIAGLARAGACFVQAPGCTANPLFGASAPPSSAPKASLPTTVDA